MVGGLLLHLITSMLWGFNKYNDPQFWEGGLLHPMTAILGGLLLHPMTSMLGGLLLHSMTAMLEGLLLHQLHVFNENALA